MSLILIFTSTAKAQQTSLQTLTQSDGIQVVEGERPVLFFQRSVRSKNGRWPRNNYIHPLYDLRGNVITEDFPEDHGHHRGIFWAWHQVIVDDQQLGDAWVCQDFLWNIQSLKTRQADDAIELVTKTHWKSSDYVDDDGQPIAVVEEQMTVTVHPAKADHRIIDFDLELKALVEDVRIGGSDDPKGYGGFSPRLKLSPDQQFVGRDGTLQPTKLALDAGPWVDVQGDDYSLLMIADQRNPAPHGLKEPTAWILREARSMQNSVYPGRTPTELSMTEPTRLRYRLVIHHEPLDAEAIEMLQESMAK